MLGERRCGVDVHSPDAPRAPLSVDVGDYAVGGAGLRALFLNASVMRWP